MRSVVKYALGLSLVAGTMTPSFAQAGACQDLLLRCVTLQRAYNQCIQSWYGVRENCSSQLATANACWQQLNFFCGSSDA